MQNNNKSDEQNKHQFRRTVSLDPRMSSPEDTTNETTIHVNPLFDGQEVTVDSRNASLRRQVSEPASNRNRISDIVVTRTESIKSMVVKKTQQFFGINEDNHSDKELWNQRKRRLISTYGKMKPKEPTAIRLQTRQSLRQHSAAIGLDETDGAFQTNQINGITDTIPDLSPEDSSRRPALVFAIALASNAFKKMISKQNDQPLNETAPEQSRAQPLSFQRPLYTSDEDLDESNDDFFVKPPEESPGEVEVDGQRLMTGQPRIGNKWSIQRQQSVKAKSIPEKLIETLLKTDNSNRRQLGKGLIDRLLDWRLKKNLTKEDRKAIDHIDDYRPYFTYWITTVQILILIISLSVYGFGHFGFGFAQISGLVYVKSLSLQQVDYFEPENFWGGPRAADLIHLGAKFTPCMRRDPKIYDIISDERSVEKNTGCCIRNDGGGCVQTSQSKCSPLLSTWHKWPNSGSMERTSGPVCGQDPRFCEQPASIEPYEWANDITKWPICRKKGNENSRNDPHMKCELIGRPCCIGVYGECHITTREHCNFLRGFFHESATLCSQVSCMENVCGMIPFYSKDIPDQKVRLLTPIFLHAGLIHLLITVSFQFIVMKDIEKMTGAFRISIIYLGSGFVGYLASAVFLPFRPEVGPAGSLYGVLACLIVQVINMWKWIERPVFVLLKLIGVAVVLILLGFLPWIDNYAHLFGFITGLLLSKALLPNMDQQNNKMQRIIQIIICLLSVIIIILILFVLLYNYPIYDINFFKYFNCIPFTSDWCENQNIQSNRVDIL